MRPVGGMVFIIGFSILSLAAFFKIPAYPQAAQKTTIPATEVQLTSVQVNEDKPSDLEVRISALKSVIVSGDTLQLRVEIWNMGNQDIFICKDFQGSNLSCGNLRLNFIPASGGPRILTARDYDPFSSGKAKKGNFANTLVNYWISIPPKHFYGTIIEVDPVSYGIGKVGRYRISGEYGSGGLLAEVSYNSLLAFPEEVSQLPGKSWRGRVDTNSVEVRVIPKK